MDAYVLKHGFPLRSQKGTLFSHLFLMQLLNFGRIGVKIMFVFLKCVEAWIFTDISERSFLFHLILVDLVDFGRTGVYIMCVYKCFEAYFFTEISVRTLFFNLVLIESPDELGLGLCVCI